MNRTLAALFATMALMAGCSTGPVTESPAAASPSVASAPTPAPSTQPTTPSSSPTSEPSAGLVTHALAPFGPDGFDDQDPRAASITFTFDAPASWERFEEIGVWIDGNGPPEGADLMFFRGMGLYGEPCLTDEAASPDIAVGPTVDDFVTALVDHPSIDVTAPVDVTLAGYPGQYLDLQVPDDIGACATYKPLDGHHYAQGPGQRWHMWVLDVGGVRVLVETNDFAGTSAQRLGEVQAMIDSLQIEP